LKSCANFHFPLGKANEVNKIGIIWWLKTYGLLVEKMLEIETNLSV